MLLYDLIEKCSYRDKFQNEHEQCEDCSYGDNCPGDCQKCMQYVHYPQNAPVPRKYDCVHMAHFDIVFCFIVNGVASLHTEIMKQPVLNNFYKIYPE